MLHIPGRFITILQVEKDAMEPVYEFLKQLDLGSVFFEPQDKEIERYIYETNYPIILQSLISKSPIQSTNNFTSITIEKLLVDLYCDKKLFSAYQGRELAHIIDNSYRRYAIDFTKLISYARRRKKDSDIKEFMSEKTDIPKILLND